MQYHCMVYFDPKEVFSGTPEANAILAETGPHTGKLQSNGHLVSTIPLNLPSEAITVTMRGGKISTIDGPFLETKEMIGGFMVIEAKDMNEAIRIASGIPHAKMGHVEIRPAIDFGKPRPKL